MNAASMPHYFFDQLYYGITNMNIEELRAQWEIDCNIDTNDLSAESAR